MKIGIQDIKIKEAYSTDANTFFFITKKISEREYKAILINNGFIDYDHTIWYDEEHYLLNIGVFIRVSKETFIKKLKDATEKIINNL